MGVDQFKKLLFDKAVLKWLGSVVSGIVAICSVSYGYISTKLDDTIDTRIELHQAVQDSIQRKQKPFRELLGEALQVPSEVVHQNIAKKFKLLDSLQSQIKDFEEDYLPFVEKQMKIFPVIRFIDEHGDERQAMPDGRDYPILYEDSQKWIIYHGHRVNLSNI